MKDVDAGCSVWPHPEGVLSGAADLVLRLVAARHPLHLVEEDESFVRQGDEAEGGASHASGERERRGGTLRGGRGTLQGGRFGGDASRRRAPLNLPPPVVIH